MYEGEAPHQRLDTLSTKPNDHGSLLFVLCKQNQDIAIADVGTTIHANLPSSNETPKSRYNKNKLTYAYKLKNERLPHLNKHVYQIHVG